MAKFKIGSFVKNNVLGSQAITGVGFTPKAIIFWASGSSAASGVWSNNHIHHTLGYTSGPTESYSFGSYSQDDVAPAFANGRLAAKALVLLSDAAYPYLTSDADLTSFDVDGFTLNWTTQDAAVDDAVIMFLAIGGDDVSAKVVTWDVTASGNKAVTGVGFSPDLVLHAVTPGLSFPQIYANAAFGLGVMDKLGNQWFNANYSDSGENPSSTGRDQNSNSTIELMSSPISQVEEAQFVSMDVDGFTVNFIQAITNAYKYFSLCLTGVEAKAGVLTSPTGTPPVSQPISAVGFEPEAVLLSSTAIANSNPRPDAAWAFGAGDAVNEVTALYVDVDNVSPTDAKPLWKNDKVIALRDTTTGGIDAEADLSSLDTDGFTLNWTTTHSLGDFVWYVALGSPNNPPNAPTLLFPTSNETIAVDQSNILDWDFSDPDSGDSQSRAVGEIRVAGGAVAYSWDEETTSTQHTLAADTLGAGDYEWRVKTYDAQGVEGPWSVWEPFTGAVTPGAPTITSHATNQIVSQETELVEWSTSTQEAYQGQRVADNAGVIDPGTIYWDSGTVESVITRARNVDFPVNNRFEWIRWRIKRDGLWSPWAEVRIEVSYTPPAIPLLAFVIDNEDGSITVDITNPTPDVGEPTVESNELFKRKSVNDPWVRIATAMGVNSSYVDYSVAVGHTYQYYVQAFGDNGTSSVSIIEAAPTITFRGSRIHPVNNPSAGYGFKYNGEGGESIWTPEVYTISYAGRTLPVAEFGETEKEEVSVNLSLDGATEVAALQDLVKQKTILCYRDNFGRLLFGIVPELNLRTRFYGAQSTVLFQGVAYSEEV